MLYDMLIVDDEEIIQEGLVQLLDWKSIGYNIVAIASDGESAISVFKEKQPHAVLLDINMPNKNGIEVLKEIKEMNAKTEVILLSGFDEFKYAQQGIALGAFSYILKIDLVDELEETLVKLREKLEKRKIENNEVSILKNNYIIKQLINAGGDIDVKNQYNYSNYFVMIVYGECDISKIYTLICSQFSNTRIIYGTDSENTIFIVMSDKPSAQRQIKKLCLLKKLVDYLEKNKLFLGISSIGDSVNKIEELYVEAYKSIDVLMEYGNRIIAFDDIKDKEGENDFEVETIQNLFLADDIEGVKEVIHQLFISAYRSKSVTINDIKLSLTQIILMIKKIINRENSIIKKEIKEIVSNIGEYNLMHPLEKYMIKACAKLSQEYNEIKTSDKYHNIYAAIVYVNTHYCENIKLEKIAVSYYINPNYFSIKFKKITGFTFGKYIANLRIEKACDYLLTTDYKIYEIADMVGYRDVRHFGKVFSNSVGCTPREYRKRKQS